MERRAILQKALAEGSVVIDCGDWISAYNLRQKLYRYRNLIRNDSKDELQLLVEHLRFEVGSTTLKITYEQPDKLLVENLIQ